MKIDKRKEELIEKLSEIFVNKYNSFKESIEKINIVFKEHNIQYQYTYNDFCREYIERCIEYMDNNPNIDLNDNNGEYFLIYTDITTSMILDKEKYYNENDKK